jgi:cyclophilin family peptidyl-prolyl cis-trans isomerase
MSSSRRRGRRVPPKHGSRSLPPLPSGAGPAADPSVAPLTDAQRAATRAQNRAAKRAASGVETRRVRGRVSGRRNRGYNPAVLGLAVAAVVVAAAVFLIGNPLGGAGPSASPGGSEIAAGSETPAATRLLTGCPTAAPTGLAAGESRTVTISTPKGDIVMVVSANLAPVAAANFVALATCGYYDGVVFHRIVPGFVIQGGDGQYGWSGGDMAQAGQGGPGYQFNDEPVIGDYTRGTVAMANAGANTNGSQFFIVVADACPWLDGKHTVFGRVTSGMEVADAISNVARDSRDKPSDEVTIERLEVG